MTAWVEQNAIAESLLVLDARLLRMVEAVHAQSGREPGSDPFRGLYVSESDVLSLLKSPEPPFEASRAAAGMASGDPFQVLAQAWDLSGFELDVLLVALSPEVDPRYERIFGYLQDDVSRKWPTVDLILNLLCHSSAEKLRKRAVFRSSNPLVRRRLIRLSGDDFTAMPQREVSTDPRIAAFLLGDAGLDPRIARFATLLHPRESSPGRSAVGKLALASMGAGERLAIYFEGDNEHSKRETALALASEIGAPLLAADLSRAAQAAGDFDRWLDDLAREAVLQRAIIYREGLDALPGPGVRDTVLREVSSTERVAIFSGVRPWKADESPVRGVVAIRFERPEWPERRKAWKAALRERRVKGGGSALDALAECFRFEPAQIDDAVLTAANVARYRNQSLSVDHVFEAARARSGHELASLTRKVKPAHCWQDIVLPEDALCQLREICQRVTRRHHVLGDWGFSRKLSSGKGVNALFHGHSGTGKTMAAEVIAQELRLDLYKIDLAGVVSKYIGETEKNLDRIFTAAEAANAILLFDEADALFGKRSEVRDSHDRYANLEISYLLQKMEQYEGVAILATNLRQNLDDAFLRRITFSVQFPFPDAGSRRRIWEGIWPEETPRSPDLDLDWLSARFLLSGGNIRNVALAAAYLAVEENRNEIAMTHVVRAIRAEFQKLGKTLTLAEVAPPQYAAAGARV